MRKITSETEKYELLCKIANLKDRVKNDNMIFVVDLYDIIRHLDVDDSEFLINIIEHHKGERLF